LADCTSSPQKKFIQSKKIKPFYSRNLSCNSASQNNAKTLSVVVENHYNSLKLLDIKESFGIDTVVNLQCVLIFIKYGERRKIDWAADRIGL
jgi:hypothetical protein